MTTNYHTPVANGAPANSGIINTPLGQLDEAITNLQGSSSEITKVLTTQFDKTNDTLEAIPGLSMDVVSGNGYMFRGVFRTSSDVAAGAVLGMDGTCAASLFTTANIMIEGNVGVLLNTYVDSLSNTLIGFTAVQNALIIVEGIIIVTDSGTLYPLFCQNASNVSSSSVLLGSTFTLKNLGAMTHDGD